MVIRIALSGKLRSGKTTTREMFQELGKKHFDVDFVYLSLAAPIYEEAYAFYRKHGLVWTTKDRKLLEGMGEALNDKYPGGDKIVELYAQQLEKYPGQPIINDDIRRTTQANYLKGLGFTLVRVDCPDTLRRERCKEGEWSEGAITDTELDSYEHFDYKIENTGSLDALYRNVWAILNDLKEKSV